MKTTTLKDLAPWLLLPSMMLALSSVTLLVPHQAALAGPPAATNLSAVSSAAPQAPAGDGDGDELLEHWGDPQFSEEERTQMGGIAAVFLVLGAAAAVRRSRRPSRAESAVLPRESHFSPLDDSCPHSDTRKAA